MAKEVDESKISKNVNNILTALFNIGSTNTYSTYGITKDLYDTDRLLNKLTVIQKKDEDKIKRTVDGNHYANSRINTFGLLTMGDKARMARKNGIVNTTQAETIFDVLKSNTSIFGELREQMLLNNRFYNTISDYEILRRAIPEVSRVINLLINSVLTPEVITSNTFNLNYKFDTSKTEIAKKLKTKYELDKKIRIIVENYFVIGVEYITVIPYKSVIESIKLNAPSKSIIKESALLPIGSQNSQVITESALIDSLDAGINNSFRTIESRDSKVFKDINKNIEDFKRSDTRLSNIGTLNRSINDYLDGFKIYKSNKKIIYDDARVESIQSAPEFIFESSFEEFFDKDAKKPKNMTKKDDGVVDVNKEYDKIDVPGCKIERLDPSRVYPIRMHDTVIAYVYVEERRDEILQYNLQSHMNSNFSFYRLNQQNTMDYTMKMIEDRMIKEIGRRIIGSLSPKFLEVNFKDMDVFYEFLRDNDLHKHKHDIILLHPDDVVEFKRTDGSVMKNAVFFARLYLMIILNNILTKVRKGSDRTIYYVDNGLTNDLEGSVMAAIEAIEQSQVRVSDVGTISGIMNAVGSVVDLFVPQSSDGVKPINPDVLAGQQVEMDEEFLKYLIKSIILSFNMPPVVADATNEVEFAKTLSMANLDVATSSALTQSEINPQLTKLLRKVMAYDLNLKDDEIETIEATLIPSRSMMMQITNELLSTTKDLATSMADINVTTDDSDMLKKLFIKNFVRKYLNYEWAEIDKILESINEDKIESDLKTDATTPEPSEEDLANMAEGEEMQ